METSEQKQVTLGGKEKWSSPTVYTMGAICLASGLLVGYLARGTQSPVLPAADQAAVEQTATPPAMPSMDRMKHMADKQAEPLLEEAKSKPKDAALLAKVARTYFSAHQFEEAISYAERAVEADPKHAGNRADLASYYYYAGNVDKAIASLEAALELEPTNPQALFNLGMMKLKGKQDAPGAVAAWKELLKTNPKLPAARKAAVEKAIASASENKIAAK